MRPRRMKIASEDTEQGQAIQVGETEADSAREGPTLRSLKRPLLVLGSLLVAAYVLAAVALMLLVDPDQVRSWVQPQVSAALNREVSVGDVGISVLPRPSARLSDVRIENLSGFEGPRLAHITEARLDVAWLPLLVGRVNVYRIHLDGLGLHVSIDEHGISNFGDLVPERSEGARSPASAPLDLGVGQVVVTNATLNYFDAVGARSFAVTGARADAALYPDGEGGWRADFTARSDSLHAWALDANEEVLRMEGPAATLALSGNASRRSLDVDEGVLVLGSESLAVRGHVSDLTGSEPSFEVELGNDAMRASVLVGALSAGTRAKLVPLVEGTLGVRLLVRGAPGTAPGPLIRGTVHLEDVAVRLGGQLVADDVSGTVSVTTETFGVDSLSGRFAGGPFELSGVVSRDTRVASLVASAQPDLDELDRMGLVPSGVTLSGDALLDLSVAGPLHAPDSVQVVGVATLDGFQAKHTRFGEPLYVPAGEVTILGQEVLWSDLMVLVGQDRLITTGRVYDVSAAWSEERTPEVDVSFAGPRLDLDALLPAQARASEATYGQLAFAHLGGHRLDGRTAASVAEERGLSRPGRLPAYGSVEVTLDTLTYRGYTLESVGARVDLMDSALAVEDASFDIWGGHATGSLVLGVGTANEEPFRLTVIVDGTDARRFLGMTTPLGDAVSGTLSMDLQLEGATDRSLLPVPRNLTGRAQASVLDGRIEGTGPNMALSDFLETDDWSSVDFGQWVSELVIQDRAIELRDVRLIGEPGQVALSGFIAFDGYADLSVGVSIPPDRLDTVSLRRTGVGPSVLDQLRSVGSPLDLGLRLKGPIGGLQLEADASNAVTLARFR